jgi:hypothetical protein
MKLRTRMILIDKLDKQCTWEVRASLNLVNDLSLSVSRRNN